MNTVTFIILIVLGIYLIGAGIFRIGLKTRKAIRIVGMIGEAGTRILYTVIGISLIVIAILSYF